MLAVLLGACGASSRAAVDSVVPSTTGATKVPATSTSTSTAAVRTEYTAPPLEQSLFDDRIWYPDLNAVVAAVDDIVIATVTTVGPVGPVPVPSGSGLTAPIVTLAVERNVLHPTVSTAVTVYDMCAVGSVGRTCLSQGQRVLAFLVHAGGTTVPVSHGLMDYLVVDASGRLRSAAGSASGLVSAGEAPRGRGASFLDQESLEAIVEAIEAIRPPS